MNDEQSKEFEKRLKVVEEGVKAQQKLERFRLAEEQGWKDSIEKLKLDIRALEQRVSAVENTGKGPHPGR